MIIRQQKSERVCASFHVSAYKTKVLIIICAAKLLYCNGFAKQGGVKNVKESDFLSFVSIIASFLPMCVRLKLLKSAISRQANANKFSLVFWLNEIVHISK